jgi:ubiquinone/menaquinone biosynthesis C-methylase UbiE
VNETATAGMDVREKWRSDTKREWSDADKVAAWRKWGRSNHRAQEEATTALSSAVDLAPGQRVIDIAGGGGDPSLFVARAVGPDGRVTVTDVSPGMLETTRHFAKEDGLANIETHEADAEALPFEDESFDRAVCRCGVMFFADLDRGLREIRRVLKPGGRASFLVWGPLEQIGFFTSIFGPVRKYLNPPPPPPDAPWPFRFSEPGSLAAALREAGFRDVSEETLQSHYRFDGSPEDILQMMLDMGGLHGMLAELPAATKEALLAEALENYRAFADGSMVSPTTAYALASGVKGDHHQ